jgi:hypothetical protein
MSAKKKTTKKKPPVDRWARLTARLMLGKGCCPKTLGVRLDRVSELIRERGGALRSRQAVAVVVEQWEREEGGR